MTGAVEPADYDAPVAHDASTGRHFPTQAALRVWRLSRSCAEGVLTAVDCGSQDTPRPCAAGYHCEASKPREKPYVLAQAKLHPLNVAARAVVARWRRFASDSTFHADAPTKLRRGPAHSTTLAGTTNAEYFVDRRNREET